MKQADLKPCACCGKGIMHAGTPVFYRVKIESLCVDVGAVKRQHGLEMMMGNAAIAFHMGPQEDLAKVIDQREALICLQCATEERLPLAMLLEERP